MLILTYYDTFAITKNVRSYKKKSKASKENYRPLSILPNVSKLYEICIYNQM